MPLQPIEPQIHQLAALVLRLDALADHLATDGAPHVENGAHEFELGAVSIDAADEIAVDLHVVWSELGPGAQARVPCPEIVDGDLTARLTQALERRAQTHVVVEQAV